jgi:NAD(P)H dehydrogenase (quinone)
MRVHLIYANPKPDGLCASLFHEVTRSLGEHDVDSLDLYCDRFDPVKPPDEVAEHGRRMDATYAPQALDAIDPYVDRLLRAEALVVIFPVWYFGLPAILKGYFDRVLLPGTAFAFEGGRMRGRLDRLRAVVGIATYGAPRLAAWWFGDPTRRFIRQQLAAMATRRPVVRYLPVHCASQLDLTKGRATIDRIVQQTRRAIHG